MGYVNFGSWDNDQNEWFVDSEGCSYPSYESYVITGLLGLCGCFDDDLGNDIMTILRQFAATKGHISIDDIKIDGHEQYRELILHDLTRVDLLEHGGNVGGSWLTDKGREVATKLLERYKKAQEV